MLTLEGETNREGVLSIALPPGAYEVKISKRWFKDTTTQVNVLGDETLEVKIEPGIVARVQRLSPYIVAVLGALIASTIILWARREISERLKEEYF